MADQMIRISGRGVDGLAKAIRTDNNGVMTVNSKQLESIKIVDAVAVPTGTLGATVIAGMTVSGLNNYRIGMYTSAETVATVEVHPIFGGYRTGKSDVAFSKVPTSRTKTVMSKRLEMKTNDFALSIINHGSESVNFTVFLYKVGNETFIPTDTKLIHDPLQIASSVIVPANTKLDVVSLSVYDALAFNLGIQSLSSAEIVSVGVNPIVNGFMLDGVSYGFEPIMVRRPLNNKLAMTNKYLIKSPEFKISVTNHSPVETTLNIFMFKSTTANGCQDYVNSKEIYGGSLDDRPNTYAVALGVVYMQTDTQAMWLNTSNGWVAI